ncbi:hypothetical protein [Deinococcus multiflagellatus]|uniref:Type II secretion system protein GspE N-terminal domain-containing protein n=1 Tax=Deinococcus multiflagellatus TaxID=1656887 RepID=A0ABW1ZQL3_9DEIO|nr:hypothetical protein [Deinococcus multiflagellatus]MBZ9714954.1 general secretion pathway protein E [Deinococcus multiflagellatus]
MMPLSAAEAEQLELLSSLGTLTPQQLEAVTRECHRGSTLTTALTLLTDERQVWAALAEDAGKPFYDSHLALQVFCTDMFDFRVALEHQILPHRPQGDLMEVITYNTGRLDGPAAAIDHQHLVHSVVSPTVWRYLYDLAYPTCLTGTLDALQARALITCTPLGTPTTCTPEQDAEILAMTHGLHAIDVRRQPVDENVRDLISPAVKALCRAYPHRLEGAALVVMMVDPHDELALHRLRQQTQRPIVPNVTTQSVIDALIEEDWSSGRWPEL